MPRKLEFHDVIPYEGRLHRVVMVNESRALIVPVDKRAKVIKPQTGENAGKVLTIAVTEHGVSICPESDVPLAGRWDPAQNKMRGL